MNILWDTTSPVTEYGYRVSEMRVVKRLPSGPQKAAFSDDKFPAGGNRRI